MARKPQAMSPLALAQLCLVVDSLDHLIRAANGDTVRREERVPAPAPPRYSVEERLDLERALLRLDDRTRACIAWRYWYGETLAEISQRLSLSRERIRQIINTGLVDMRRFLDGEGATDGRH